MPRTITGALIVGALMVGGCTTASHRDTGRAEVVGPHGRVLPEAAAPISGSPALRLLVTDPRAVSNGAVNTFYLNDDGTGRIVVEPNQAAVGVGWSMPNANALCFDWPVRGRECWPYQSLRVGQPVRVTSDQDVTAEITLLRDLHMAHHQPMMQQPMPAQPHMAPPPARRSGERG
jgi:hypothetical protein